MEKIMKNRLFTWLLALLLLANAVTLAFFWVDRAKPGNGQKGGASGYLIQQLNFSDEQKQKFELLVKEHRMKTQELRPMIKAAKDSMFGLVKQSGVSDSAKRVAAEKASEYIMQLDLYTLDHFQKIREICDPEQQKKFDQILNELTSLLANQRPPGRQGRNPQGPPAGDRNGGRGGPPPGQ